jgi:hypothetical protein
MIKNYFCAMQLSPLRLPLNGIMAPKGMRLLGISYFFNQYIYVYHFVNVICQE